MPLRKKNSFAILACLRVKIYDDGGGGVEEKCQVYVIVVDLFNWSLILFSLTVL